MKVKKIPQRSCIGCGTKKDKKDLIRIVRTPDGDIVLDRTGKKAGRGAYVCDDPSCIQKAFASKSLEKIMKTDEQLYFALGLAQKAGKTASGDMAVSEALKKGMGCYAVLAEDAAPRTVEKVVALCKETHVPFTKRLTAARLGQALGKAPRAAVVLLDKNFMKMMI